MIQKLKEVNLLTGLVTSLLAKKIEIFKFSKELLKACKLRVAIKIPKLLSKSSQNF